jgi:hypothetical protein
MQNAPCGSLWKEMHPMNDQEFSKYLQDLIIRQGPAAADPAVTFARIIHKDKRRVKLLAWLTIFFWLLGAAGLLLLAVALDRLLVSVRFAESPSPPEEKLKTFGNVRGRAQMREEAISGTTFLQQSIPFVLISALAVLAASLFTVFLVLSSRRATLRQISIGMMTLAEEIKQLRGKANDATASG